MYRVLILRGRIIIFSLWLMGMSMLFHPFPIIQSAETQPHDAVLEQFLKNRERTKAREAVIASLVQALERTQRAVAEHKIEKLDSVIQNLQKAYQEWKENTIQEREWLVNKGFSGLIIQRHDDSVAHFEASIQPLLNFLTPLLEDKRIERQVDDAQKAELISDAEKMLDKLVRQLFLPALRQTTPFRVSPNEKIITQQTSKSFSVLSEPIWPLAIEPIPADLEETEEIIFTNAITALAASLNNDALEIFQYVKNTIDFVPYYGSKKGSDNTLLEKAGNDIDTASFLLALLRVSNIPSHYVHGKIRLTPSQMMEWLGVDNPWTAAQIIANTWIPHIVFVDAVNPETILLYEIEHTWVEVYVPYGNYRGLGIDDSDKLWIPLDASWKRVYYAQSLNLPDEMGFDITSFYEEYLSGVHTGKPLEVYKQQLTDYLASTHPELSYEDILTTVYQPEESFEFLPNTLPYEVVEVTDTPSALAPEMRHQIRIKISDAQTTYLEKVLDVSMIANKQIVLSAVAATSTDQQIIDEHGGLYETPPYLVDLKPVLRINGEEIARGNAYGMGLVKTLSLDFLMPKKIASVIQQASRELIEKDTILGNDEGIAINTDRIIPPEIVEEETPSQEFVAGQKLYRTSLNYLERLQRSQDEIGKTLGGTFTNLATRAIVFNGIALNPVDGAPQTFTWLGLRIDSSANVNYFSHFGEVNNHKKEFLMLWGLEGSYAEATIFEEDFEIDAISTVKGLALINQGVIQGVDYYKITEAEVGIINTLNISEATKVTMRDAVYQGHIIYTPSGEFTYQNWTGLVYINLDPIEGDGGYIIGENLNGGYTVEQWPEGWSNFWRKYLLPNLTAKIITPLNGQTFTQGDIIKWFAYYESTLLEELIHAWNEELKLNTKKISIGNIILRSGYGTDESVEVEIKGPTIPIIIDCTEKLEGRSLPADSGVIWDEMHIPLRIDNKSGIYKERFGGQVQYNTQDNIYTHPTSFPDFFYEVPDGDANINNPWQDPKTGKYWNMSITYGAFNKQAVNEYHEKYYIAMRWKYTDLPKPEIYEEQRWYFGKKVWIKNPNTRKAVVVGILDWGPAESTGRVAGASLEALDAIGAEPGVFVEFCWAADQDVAYGAVVSY